MLKLPKISQGFTIIELLIVIIVIAVLATITVVAYSGVTTRAENVKTLDAVSKYADALAMYRESKGAYPSTSSNSPCFGNPESGKCGNISDMSPTCGPYSWRGLSNSTFNDDIKSSLGNVLPEPSGQLLTCGGSQYRGAYFYSWSESDFIITYFLRGDQPCDTLKQFKSVSKYQNGDATACTGKLDS